MIQFGALILNTVIKDSSMQENDNVYLEINKKKLVEETIDSFQITKLQFKARYTFIEKISQGSQGQVFKYHDCYENQNVAVKIMTTNIKETYETQKKELDLLCKVKGYENIIKIHKYILEEEDQYQFQLFMIMDLGEYTL